MAVNGIIHKTSVGSGSRGIDVGCGIPHLQSGGYPVYLAHVVEPQAVVQSKPSARLEGILRIQRPLMVV